MTVLFVATCVAAVFVGWLMARMAKRSQAVEVEVRRSEPADGEAIEPADHVSDAEIRRRFDQLMAEPE